MSTDTTSPKVHSPVGTLIGAAIGSAVGWGIRPVTNAHSPLKSASTAAAMLGGAVVGGLAGWVISGHKNPNYVAPSSAPVLPPPPAPVLQQTSGGGASLIVSPTITTQTVSLDVQDPVLVHLPAGASWVSMDGAPIADKTSPIAFTFLGPISHTFVWTDATNTNYQSTYFFVVNPSATPTTNA